MTVSKRVQKNKKSGRTDIQKQLKWKIITIVRYLFRRWARANEMRLNGYWRPWKMNTRILNAFCMKKAVLIFFSRTFVPDLIVLCTLNAFDPCLRGSETKEYFNFKVSPKTAKVSKILMDFSLKIT